MEIRFTTRKSETWEELRTRILAETSAYLTEGLRQPEFAVRIPTIPSGSGRFPPSLAAAFWQPVLFE